MNSTVLVGSHACAGTSALAEAYDTAMLPGEQAAFHASLLEI